MYFRHAGIAFDWKKHSFFRAVLPCNPVDIPRQISRRRHAGTPHVVHTEAGETCFWYSRALVWLSTINQSPRNKDHKRCYRTQYSCRIEQRETCRWCYRKKCRVGLTEPWACSDVEGLQPSCGLCRFCGRRHGPSRSGRGPFAHFPLDGRFKKMGQWRVWWRRVVVDACGDVIKGKSDQRWECMQVPRHHQVAPRLWNGRNGNLAPHSRAGSRFPAPCNVLPVTLWELSGFRSLPHGSDRPRNDSRPITAQHRHLDPSHHSHGCDPRVPLIVWRPGRARSRHQNLFIFSLWSLQ